MGAAVCAEYLQAYLPDTGDALVLLAGLVVLGPLYGGAALLIRETALRTGRGWPGTLLMAAAFGLLMTSQVDGSMWLVHDPEIAYWDELRAGTLLDPLGFAVFPVLSWVTGHVVFSIGAPLVLLDALAPRDKGKPLLGRLGLVIVAALCLGAALLIRNDPQYAASDPTGTQATFSLLVAIGLVALALSPAGRSIEQRTSEPVAWTPVRTLGIAGVLLLALDLMSFTWIGLSLYVVVLTAGLWWVVRASRSRTWGVAQTTALGVAAIVERTLIGFLAPLPPGVAMGSKVLQSIVLLGLVVAASFAAWRRAISERQPETAAGCAPIRTRPERQLTRWRPMRSDSPRDAHASAKVEESGNRTTGPHDE